MDAIRSVLQPITHNLPTPIHNLGVFTLGQECYTSLLLDIDPTASQCVKLAISKSLSIGIISASFVMKSPQILVLMVPRTTPWDFSLPNYLLETSAYLATLAYNVRSGFPFSTFGETALAIACNVVISVVVLGYNGKMSMGSFLVAALAVSCAVLFNKDLVDMEILSYLQAGAAVSRVVTKVQLAAQVWQQGGIGELISLDEEAKLLSAIGVFVYLAGSFSRIFTTLQEVDDKLLLYGFIARFAINVILTAQIVYYWWEPFKIDQRKQEEKPVAAEATPAAAQTTATIAETTAALAEVADALAETTADIAEATAGLADATTTPAKATATLVQLTATLAETTAALADTTGIPAETIPTPAETIAMTKGMRPKTRCRR